MNKRTRSDLNANLACSILKWGRSSGGLLRAVALLLCLMLSALIEARPAEEPDAGRKNVLVFNSYHLGAEWAESQVQGLLSVLQASDLDLELFIEQMDMLRKGDAFDEAYFRDHLQKLYGQQAFDLVIVIDDAALGFVARHYRALFSGVPVVFSDVGRLEEIDLPPDMPVTGVLEHTAFLETLQLARRLRPRASQVILFGNQADHGAGPRTAQRVISELELDIPVRVYNDLSLDEMLETVSHLSPEDILIPLALAYDSAGRPHTYEEVNKLIAQIAPTPLFGFWSLGIQGGYQLGGKVNDPLWQGESAARMGLRILRGEDARHIPMLRQAPTRYMFSYQMLQRFGISASALPQDSVVLHKPPSLYDEYKALVWATLVALLALLILNMALLFNIRRRKEAEQALRDSEQRFSSIFEHAPMGIALLEGEEGRIVASNPNMHTLIGYSADELRGMPFTDITHPDDLQKDLERYLALLLGEITHFSMEKRYLRKDGSVVWAYLTVSAIGDGKGKPRYVIGMVEDITERKRADDALRASATQLNTVITGAPIVLFSFDSEGVFTLFEGRGLEGMGLSPGEVVGQSAFALYRDQPEILEGIHRALAGETFTVRLRLAGHEYLGYHTPLCTQEGTNQGTIGVLMDITDQARAEEALRRLNEDLEQRVIQRTIKLETSNENYLQALDKLQRAQQDLVRSEKLAGLGSLFAGVAHELSTPLGTSVTLASALEDRLAELGGMIERDALDRDVLSDFIRMASEASELLTRTLLQSSELIRNFKQVAVDQTSVQRRQFQLAEVVGEVVATLQPEFKRSPHQIRVTVPAGLQMDSFPGPLGQIITNLVRNARIHAFAENTAGEVTISATHVGDDRVCLMVTDNGRGIPAEHLHRVFDPFFTTRLGQGGSGLGLHIVYNIATRILGGRVDVSSEPGEGTRFILEMPCQAPVAEQGAAADLAS